MTAAATPAPQSTQAQKAPVLYIVIFVAATVLWSFVTVSTLLGFVNTASPRPVENDTLNGSLVLACVVQLSLTSTALVGLYLRKHWGRSVATIAALFWCLTVVLIPGTAIVLWLLHRRWDAGVESSFFRDHPAPPAYLTGLIVAGMAGFLAWLWFLYLWLVPLIQTMTKHDNIDPNSWYAVVSFALFFSMPIWVLHVVTFLGLRRRHDWGAILAAITCIVWTLSLYGTIFGIAGLIFLWRWEHPALAPIPARAA